MGGRRESAADGSGIFALKRQNSIRIANQESNLDEGDVMPSNRMADESFAEEKDNDENSQVSNQPKALTKKLTDFADRNVKESITNGEMSQLAYAAFLADLYTIEKISDTTDDERMATQQELTPCGQGRRRESSFLPRFFWMSFVKGDFEKRIFQNLSVRASVRPSRSP